MKPTTELEITESLVDLLETLGLDTNLLNDLTISKVYDQAQPWQTLVLNHEHLATDFDGAVVVWEREHRRTVIEFRTTTYTVGG